MQIAAFLARTRHVRPLFPHEEAYRFSEDAGTIISRFCKTFSIPTSDIVFHPAYTSRASPELIQINTTSYIIWDYHFTELMHSLDLATLTLLLIKAEDPIVAESVSRDSVLRHFRASVFRFLSCQFFRRPHISLALAEAFAQLAHKLRAPLRRDLTDQISLQRDFQWSYVLNHELAHFYFGRLTDQEKKENFDWARQTIETTRDLNNIAYEYANSNTEAREQREEKWWSKGDDDYQEMMASFSAGMLDNFDAAVAEEMLCDHTALRLAVIHWCLANSTPFDFADSRCVFAMESARAAVINLNNFRLALETLRVFWERLAQRYLQHAEMPRSVIAEERDKAARAIQEVFLRATTGLEAGWNGLVASALGQRELRLDNPRFLAHTEKSRKERETGEGVEGLHERFAIAWDELREVAAALTADEVVEMLLNSARQKAAELSPQQALRQAQEILEW